MNNGIITVGLIGNPNTGKTSLLNSLAGLNLHIGNWPGKTVEKKEGLIKFQGHKIKIVDLPGTYSILPYSDEEKVSHNFIVSGNVDIIVQVIDVNFLARNLLLAFELLAMGKKIILAFNFNKEAQKNGLVIRVNKIKKVLKVPIIEVEANTGENTGELLKKIISYSEEKFFIPSYLSSLVKGDTEIRHRKVLDFIENNVMPYCTRISKLRKNIEMIDRLVLNKYSALPIFILVMFLMFKITFSLSAPIVSWINSLSFWLGKVVLDLNLPEILSSFLVEGLIGGIFSVVAFTPLIFILFFIIALLEDSGYLSRTVVLVDRVFHKFGISGRSFIPMILGFGCNVPAIMATRIIKDKKERYIAIFVNSFMSCSARLPVYMLFTGIFFPVRATAVIMVLYLVGMLVALASSFILSKIIRFSGSQALIIELPPYRRPFLKTVFRSAWTQTSQFLKKAGTIILLVVMVVWLMASLPHGAIYGSADSWLGKIGKFIAPIFKPLGFGHWVFSVALIFGLVSKEVIIGTLGTLYGVSSGGLAAAISGQLTPLSAFAFLIFILLYMPCLATVAVIKKEIGSWKLTILHSIAVIAVAWLAAFFVYQAGLVLGF